jgi:regulator of nucleoside diphosphate kinase
MEIQMKRAILTKEDYTLLGLLPDHRPLERKLARASVLPADRVPADVVTMNSRVRFRDGEAERHAKLVYPGEADGRGRVSVLSPLGAALLGLSAGQQVQARFPGSAPRRIRVEAVLSQPERTLRRHSLDEKLDAALEQTFPASDPFAFALGF